MLSDNVIAFDCLEREKRMIDNFTKAASEAENKNLKQTLFQIRNQIEQEQQQIYHIAEQNGWYISSTKAGPQQISRVNNFFQQTYRNPTQQMNYQYQQPQQQVQYQQQGQPGSQSQYQPSQAER
ncbi:MAG: spore coat protein [Halanaerobiales bacterium]